MNNFDLKKFLIENKLTNTSRILRENEEVDRELIKKWYFKTNPQADELTPEQEEEGLQAHFDEWMSAKDEYKGNINDYFADVERQGDWYPDNKTTTASKDIKENEDVTVTGEESTPNQASKYLKHESVQAILSELDNELALAQLEIKKEQIQKIVQEIEGKISTLEEDAGMQGFVDKAAINGKRKIVKELNREYEKVNRIYEKMHAKFNKKNKKKNLNEVDDMGSSPSYNAKTENVITFLSFENGLEFTIGDVDQQDTGVLISIMKLDNGFQLSYASDSGEGYGHYYDFNGNEVEEDNVF